MSRLGLKVAGAGFAVYLLGAITNGLLFASGVSQANPGCKVIYDLAIAGGFAAIIGLIVAFFQWVRTKGRTTQKSQG